MADPVVVTVPADTQLVAGTIPAASRETAFRVPLPGWPRAVFRSDYGFGHGALYFADGDRPLVRVPNRAALESGVVFELDGGEHLELRLHSDHGGESLDGRPDGALLRLYLDGVEALREDELSAPPSRSAWIHAVIALAGSAAGFVAGYLYLLKAQELASPWALKMAYHTAGWHLLLTLTLFPASVWGQRRGIRAVQLVSLIFFCIHVGIAIANWASPDSLRDGAIAVLNSVSGLLFLLSVIYGQRAHRDMDPLRSLFCPSDADTEARPSDADTEADTQADMEADTQADMEADMEADTQADMEADTQADMEADTQADREADREADRAADTQARASDANTSADMEAEVG